MCCGSGTRNERRDFMTKFARARLHWPMDFNPLQSEISREKLRYVRYVGQQDGRFLTQECLTDGSKCAEALYSSTSRRESAPSEEYEGTRSRERAKREERPKSKSGRRRKRDRERGAKGSEKVEKQNAALKVDGVSCYVLLSTLGRSPISTYLFSSVDGRE